MSTKVAIAPKTKIDVSYHLISGNPSSVAGAELMALKTSIVRKAQQWRGTWLQKPQPRDNGPHQGAGSLHIQYAYAKGAERRSSP